MIFVYLPVCVMWGNGISWALMLTILSNPQWTGQRVTHTVKKFKVPEYVEELLQSLLLAVGFGIRGTSSRSRTCLLTGRPVSLHGFMELGSLMLYEGWALPTCNMPSCHALITGSVLNKQVSRADDRWGKQWSQIPDSLKVYALADIKHGWVLYTTIARCLLRDLFPDPEAVLYLTGVTQRDFVVEFNALLMELLVGTEIQAKDLASARMRVEIASCICYRRRDRTLAEKPPGRVQLLMDLLSPWPTSPMGGCRYLKETRAETRRKYKVLHQYFKERSQPSLFDRAVEPEDEEYVLLGLTVKECTPDLELPYEPVGILGWAGLPSKANPFPELDIEAPGKKLVGLAQDHDRRMLAAILVWVLMDPTRGPGFLQQGCNDAEFRKIFVSHYLPITAALSRLGAAETTIQHSS